MAPLWHLQESQAVTSGEGLAAAKEDAWDKESTDDAGDNASSKDSVNCDAVDDSGDNASTKELAEDSGQTFDQTGETCTTAAVDAVAAAEELLKIIGPPPGLQCVAPASGIKDSEHYQLASEESTTDASTSGDETLPPARPPGKLYPPGNLRKLLHSTPLPHEHLMENAVPMKIMLGQQDQMSMIGAMGSAVTDGTMYSSSQPFENLRAHHRPRVKKESKKESSVGEQSFAPLTRSNRPKAGVLSNETAARTKLRSSAKMFKPLPFMSMSSVQAAWSKWESSAAVPGAFPETWQQPQQQQRYYGSHSWAPYSQ